MYFIGWRWRSLCDQVSGQGTTRHLASLRIHCSSGETSYLQNQESRLDIFVSIFIRCFKWISDIICFGASIEENNSFDTLFLCVINNQNIFAIIHNWDIFLGQSGGILMYSDILIFNELEIQGISRAHTLHSAALLVAIVIVYLVCGWLR